MTPLAQVGITALALIWVAALYTPMMKTEIRRVIALAQVGITALAQHTEQTAMYTPMMKTEIRRVKSFAKVGITALAAVTVADVVIFLFKINI